MLCSRGFTNGETAAALAQSAFNATLGSAGNVFIAFCMLFFAFTTIVGWYYFGEVNVRSLFGEKAVKVYAVIVVICVAIGATLNGREATASAVVADIVDVALDLANGCLRRIPGIKAGAKKAETVSMDEIESRYYLRIQVQDKPGVLGSIATLLSASNISIDSLMQRPAGEEAGDVSIIQRS